MSTCTDTCCRPEQEEGGTVLSRTTRRAAKEHACADCGQPIPKGTTYWVTAYVYDGSAAQSKSHSPRGECGYQA